MAAIDRPASYLITHGLATDADAASRSAVLASVRLGLEHGVSMVQIREKLLSARNLLGLARAAVEMAHGSSTRILINDRADIAAAARADGVHLRFDSMPTEAVRSKFPGLLIGRSVHSPDEAACEVKEADFVLFGPVFATPGKEPIGLDRFRLVCDRLGDYPVLAVGGITAGNAAEVLKAGAAGVAAIREMNEPDPLRAIMDAIK
jgi:thiamine-phosphate diphosphorylase